MEPRGGHCMEKAFNQETKPIPAHPVLVYTHTNCQRQEKAEKREAMVSQPLGVQNRRRRVESGSGEANGRSPGSLPWKEAMRLDQGVIHSFSGHSCLVPGSGLQFGTG